MSLEQSLHTSGHSRRERPEERVEGELTCQVEGCGLFPGVPGWPLKVEAAGPGSLPSLWLLLPGLSSVGQSRESFSKHILSSSLLLSPQDLQCGSTQSHTPRHHSVKLRSSLQPILRQLALWHCPPSPRPPTMAPSSWLSSMQAYFCFLALRTCCGLCPEPLALRVSLCSGFSSHMTVSGNTSPAHPHRPVSSLCFSSFFSDMECDSTILFTSLPTDM